MTIKADHEGHTIEYVEFSNEWRWNDKKYISLQEARAAINKMLAASRKVDVKAIFLSESWHNRGIFQTVRVTSLDSDGRSAWIADAHGNRSKQPLGNLAEYSDENKVKIDGWLILQEKREALKSQCYEIIAGMKRAFPEKSEDQP